MVANGFKDTYVYGSGANDFLTYKRLYDDELFTSWPAYSYVNFQAWFATTTSSVKLWSTAATDAADAALLN